MFSLHHGPNLFSFNNYNFQFLSAGHANNVTSAGKNFFEFVKQTTWECAKKDCSSRPFFLLITFFTPNNHTFSSTSHQMHSVAARVLAEKATDYWKIPSRNINNLSMAAILNKAMLYGKNLRTSSEEINNTWKSPKNKLVVFQFIMSLICCFETLKHEFFEAIGQRPLLTSILSQ